jgi:hypothetical protein
MTCSQLFNSPAQKAIFNEQWEKHMQQQMKTMGGLDANAYTKFKKDYKQGFMLGCKTKN